MEHTCEQNLNPLSMHFLTLAMPRSQILYRIVRNLQTLKTSKFKKKKSMVNDIEYKVWEW